MKITVAHNANRYAMADGHRPADATESVFEFDLDTSGVPAPSPEVFTSAVLERVYFLLNVGDDPDFGTPHPAAVEYRRRHLRSLSVGDVVTLDGGEQWAVERCGFRPVVGSLA